ncbi:hypothetical protein OEZ85_013246 [Tetradesmus obliquus]|uniref:FAS1 domain-containing protein n=1 Tax=Tetradesmus obliquus TaxID=3088 RepID=A0ABY8U935_TETOB|nr:hypothetical protein OEZ85_013246 [Tetradesmus obliquus]
MGPWRASCLLLLGLLLVSASRDDDGPKIKSLALDGEAAQAFVAQFGAAQKMTARQIEVAYDAKYIPKRQGPNFGVPEVVTAGLKYKPWKDDMHCSNYGCFAPSPNPPPYFPTIYDWASNNPEQKISTQIMQLIGVEVFQGPFTGTLFLPTDTAWSTYLARWNVPIMANNTRAEQFYANFFIKLLQYHTLLLRVYGAQLDGFNYSTVYANLNAYPHKRNVITFNSVDKFVYGGGVIHTIKQVLEPKDVFPSLTAAINSSDIFSDLRTVLDRIETEGNFSMLATLEEIPGTAAVPTNAAFASAGVDVNTFPVNELLNVVAYHFCAFTRSYRLLYYPFTGKPGKNPCLTILSRAYAISYGLAWNATKPGIAKVPEMWINYATGVYPDGLKVKRANIVAADLTMPVHSAAVISDLLIPPTNLPSNRAMAAGVNSALCSKPVGQMQQRI